jgi:hypothetical protein
MSNDYAAVITTVNAAVLLVGTVQFSVVMGKFAERTVEGHREEHDLRGRAIEVLRRGRQPDAEDLRKLKQMKRRRAFGVSKSLPAYTAGALWFALCTVLVVSTIKVLKWAGTANAGPNPDLAEDSFTTAAIAICVLVVEAYVMGFAKAVKGQRLTLRHYRAGSTAEERQQLDELIRRSARSSATPPSPASAGADPASPGTAVNPQSG